MFGVLAVASLVLVPSIIPKPVVMTMTGGTLTLPKSLVIRAPKEAEMPAAYLHEWLKKSKTPASRSNRKATIQMLLEPTRTDLGEEGYVLDVTSSGISMQAFKPAGLFYAVQSLRQMLPPSAESGESVGGSKLSLVHIEDKPRFPWRGLHLDVSRHFFSVAEIKKYIDTLALYKFNTFHWHLTDDGGWRLEIKKYPKLTSLSAWRKGTAAGWDMRKILFAENDGLNQVYGGFYTQDQVREVVRYASQRNVTVVPEIEMPGHSMTVPAAYPEVGCDESSLAAWKDATGLPYGVCYCAGKERTFEFIKDVLAEVTELFPSKFIHIGGDELDKTQWKVCADCQRRKQAEGLKDEHELQSYFIKRVEGMLNASGRRLIGWDEILEGGLAPNATVMSWRGISGGIEAAKAGHDVVMSPTPHCYFDYPYTSISTEAVYGYDPIPSELSADEGKRVLGAQGNLWTEWMETYGRVEQMTWPRAAALAEVVWSPSEGRRWIEFEGRLRDVFRRLGAMGVQFNLPGPEAKMNALVFSDTATVEFETPAVEGAVLRYTVDGQAPTAQSAVYKGPIAVAKTCEVRAALFLGAVGSQSTRVSCVKGVPSIPTTLMPGLNASVLVGRFSSVGEMAKVAPAKTVQVSDFGLGIAGMDDGYGIAFSGYIRVPESGVYTFSTTSDDGSVLRIAGALVVDNDGLHGSVEKSGKIYLPAGTYPFAVEFFEQAGAERLDVSVVPPSGAKQSIPGSWLFRS